MSHLVEFVLVLALAQTAALDSPSPRERRDAIASMAILGNRDAVPALIEAYRREPRSDVRAEIVAGLGRIRDAASIPGLAEALLSDYEKDIRLAAMDALLRLYIPVGDTGFFQSVTGVFSSEERRVIGPNVAVDASALQALADSLERDFDPEVRSEAAYTLGSLRAVDQLPALIEAAEGPRNREEASVRVAAIRALAIVASPDAGPSLTRMVRDSDDRVAEEAIQALGRTGYREGFSALNDVFRASDDDDLRELTLESISLLREPEAQPLFESLLESENDNFREFAAAGLARLDYDASSFSTRLATERDDRVRLALAFALVASDQLTHMTELVLALDSRRDDQARGYLLELGRDRGKLNAIFPHLRNPKPEIRAQLLQVLGQIGRAEARPYVQPLTQDPNTEVMQAAVDALRRLPANP